MNFPESVHIPIGGFGVVPSALTEGALLNLQQSLRCGKCKQFRIDIYSLGQCEHRFCRLSEYHLNFLLNACQSLCAKDNHEGVCPVCSMPSHATQVRKDKPLSDIASFSLQLTNLLADQRKELSTQEDKSDVKSSKGEDDVTLKERKRDDGQSDEGKSLRNEKHVRLENEQSNMEDLKRQSQTMSSNQHIFQSSASAECLGKSAAAGKDDLAKPSEMSPKTKAVSKTKENRRSLLPFQEVETKVKDGPATRRRGKLEPKDKQDKAQTDSTKDHVLSNQEKISNLAKSNINSPSRTGSAVKTKTYLTKRNTKGETLLQVATIKADEDSVRKLLQEGANPNVKDYAGWTPLHEAVNHGNTTIAELLIDNGACVNSPGLDNDTPLHDAVSNFRKDCVKLLLEKGANTQARNIHGKTPFDLAQTDKMRELLLTASDSSSVTSADLSMIQEDDMQPLCFLASILSQKQQHMLHKCAKLLQAKIVNGYTPEVTHLITEVNAEGMCPRTIKVLKTILSGRWVVSTEWLSACLQHNKKVSEEGYEIVGCSSNPSTMAPQRARQNRLQQLPGLFDGCQFFFHGRFSYPTPPREELANLIKLGGGVILTREPRLHNLDDYPYTVPFHTSASSSLADCAIFVVYDNNCPNPPQVEAQRMSYLPVSWLLDSIASFTLLGKSGYLKL